MTAVLNILVSETLYNAPRTPDGWWDLSVTDACSLE